MARILVVDDETNIRMTMRLTLEHAGHTVEVAADGIEALERFGTGASHDLVLLDQRMPGLEGLDVLREMRRRNADTRIIMATAFGTVDLAVDAMKGGARDFLRKPFTTHVLRGAVEAALSDSYSDEHSGTPEITFGFSTINGFRIEFQAGSSVRQNGEFSQKFQIRSPVGECGDCTVVLPAFVVELVKAHAGADHLPGGDRFWQALAEEALANYLWQNAAFPPGDVLRVEDITRGLRRFVDAVLTAPAERAP